MTDRRDVYRVPGWMIGLALMIASAILVVIAIVFGLALLFSMHDYVESVPLP